MSAWLGHARGPSQMRRGLRYLIKVIWQDRPPNPHQQLMGIKPYNLLLHEHVRLCLHACVCVSHLCISHRSNSNVLVTQSDTTGSWPSRTFGLSECNNRGRTMSALCECVFQWHKIKNENQNILIFQYFRQSCTQANTNNTNKLAY